MRRLLGPVLFVFLITTACSSDTTEVSSGGETSDADVAVDDVENESQQPDDGSETDDPVEIDVPSDVTDAGQDDDPPTEDVELVGQDVEREKLDEALAVWSENGHAQYLFGYGLQCECWQGPWDIVVENGDLQSFMVADDDPDALPPYQTVEAIFNQIEETLAEGRIPVRVTYDPETGVPLEYIWNEPELPVDGGFVFILEYFEVSDGGPDRIAARAEFEKAKALWVESNTADYDLNYTLGCFCVSSGPFDIEVRGGEIAAVSGPPDEGLDDQFLADVATTVDDVFVLIDEAIDSAEVFTIRYDETTGYPTLFDVDYSSMIADDEITHVLEVSPV